MKKALAMMGAVLLVAAAAHGGNGMGFGKQEIDVWPSVYGTNDAATLNDVVGRLGSEDVCIGIDGGRWLIDDDVEIPSNVAVRVKRGSYFLFTNSATMTIAGEFDAGNRAVFILAPAGGNCLVDGAGGFFRFANSNWFGDGIAFTNFDASGWATKSEIEAGLDDRLPGTTILGGTFSNGIWDVGVHETSDNFILLNTNTYLQTNLFRAIGSMLGLSGTTLSNYMAWVGAFQEMDTDYSSDYGELNGEFPNLLQNVPTNIVGATQTSSGNWLLDSYNTNIYMFSIFSGTGKLVTSGSGNIALSSYLTSTPKDPGGWWNSTTKMVRIPKTGVYAISFYSQNMGCSASMSMCKNADPTNGYFTYGRTFPSGIGISGTFVTQWSILSSLYEGDSYAFYVAPDRTLNSTSSWINWVSIQMKYEGLDAGITNAFETEEEE